VDGGITFFDTADVYNGGESEVVTGHVLRRLFGMREEYVVATKVHGQTMPGLCPRRGAPTRLIRSD
jgi:aryl-alcohol dehydrogenase-like predicted oxidoreductase